MGSWGKQFRHLGRVQENYISALNTGSVKFSTAGCSFGEPITKHGLLDYLARMDTLLDEALLNPRTSIDWFGEDYTIERHLRALVQHEVLHHGQFILYARVAGLKLPSSWEAWGE